jgi:uncharacterized protein YlzI (FlbEa/FlbD family)
MIQLTRLNNHPLAVNSDLIKFVEQARWAGDRRTAI